MDSLLCRMTLSLLLYMCSELKILALSACLLSVIACSQYKKMQMINSGELVMRISVPESMTEEDDEVESLDTIRQALTDGPMIMKAVKDIETGEMVAADVINASRVVARFRNVAERNGHVSVNFDVIVPSVMVESRWQLKLIPLMYIQKDTVALDALHITGREYRSRQLRGYQRYNNFLSSIISDSSELVRSGQLELFIERYFPDTYAMKNDSSFISDPVAENLFGVTQTEALRHYTKRMKSSRNERRKAKADEMYERFVKDPIRTEGIKLDTVLNSSDGDFIYRYEYTFRSRPSLRKVMIDMTGDLYDDGEVICHLPFSGDLTFYISSLSTMADMTPKYKVSVLERVISENTDAFVDFRQGSAYIDTAISDNADELKRIRACISEAASVETLELDSLVIVASCSPEGTYDSNGRLSYARSKSVMEYLELYVPEGWKEKLHASCLPENWPMLRKLIASDTLLNESDRSEAIDILDKKVDYDKKEKYLARLHCYRHLKECIYPKLRNVSFTFHMHRVGMVKDTIHTSEPDTLYMRGLEALRSLDYRKAASVLGPYRDYNAALAYASIGNDQASFEILRNLEYDDAKTCYLKAMVLVRLEIYDMAMEYFERSIAYDPYMEHRANLDPEMSVLVKKRQTLKQ